MTLNTGTRLGSYEIVSRLGAGGMGEVYRARDSKLDRDVAIKVLPDAFARDKERLARFEREAKLLARLSHANVATLYGLEESEGRKFLVMELVEGETLAERIARGPLAFEEAIPLFLQIAEGLEAAHEKGIIHRDLKPANMKITLDGDIKILDFGLAKAFASEQNVSAEMSQSPTLTKGTAVGAILGTPSYMSPEQARGKAVDRRTDVWAFACCLYESLTGRKAFEGETVSDTLAAVLKNEPEWERLPGDAPTWLRSILARALRKDTKRRLRDMGDVRIEIEDAMGKPASSVTPPGRAKAGSCSFGRGRYCFHRRAGRLGSHEFWVGAPEAAEAPRYQPPREGSLGPWAGACRGAARSITRRLDIGLCG